MSVYYVGTNCDIIMGYLGAFVPSVKPHLISGWFINNFKGVNNFRLTNFRHHQLHEIALNVGIF